MKKSVLYFAIAIAFSMAVVAPQSVNAEEVETTTTSIEESAEETAVTPVTEEKEASIATEPEVTAEDLGVTEPSVLPGSIFYPFKKLGEAIQETFTFNPQKKAELADRFASKRLAEARALTKTGKEDAALKVLEDYKTRLEQAQTRLANIDKDKLTDEQKLKLEKAEDRITANLLKQQKVLEKIESGVSEEKREKIRERLVDNQEKLEQRISSLPAEDQEKAKARINEIMSQLPGDDISKAEYLTAMRAVRTEVVPEVVRAQIEARSVEQTEKINAAVEAGKITAQQASVRLEAVKTRTETRLQNLDVRQEARAQIENIREEAKELGDKTKETVKEEVKNVRSEAQKAIEENKQKASEALKENAKNAIEQKKQEVRANTEQKVEKLKNIARPEPKPAQ